MFYIEFDGIRHSLVQRLLKMKSFSVGIVGFLLSQLLSNSLSTFLPAVLADSIMDPIEHHRQKILDVQKNPNDPMFCDQSRSVEEVEEGQKGMPAEIAIVPSGEMLLPDVKDQDICTACEAEMKQWIREFLDHLTQHLNQNYEVDVSEYIWGPFVCSL